MSYSPTLSEAHKTLKGTYVIDQMNPLTWAVDTKCGVVADCTLARKHLETVAREMAECITVIGGGGGGRGRLETQLCVSLGNFERDFKLAVQKQMAWFRCSCVVVDAAMVATSMEMTLVGLVALGKAAVDLLSKSLYDPSGGTYAEFSKVWEYVWASFKSMLSGRNVCYQAQACLPRAAFKIAHRPLFDPQWKHTREILANVEGEHT
jgi:hypothetical protein